MTAQTAPREMVRSTFGSGTDVAHDVALVQAMLVNGGG